MDKFDALLEAAQTHGASPTWRNALIDVADTAYLCRAWLEQYAPKYSPADLLAMTRMVIERQGIEAARIPTDEDPPEED